MASEVTVKAVLELFQNCKSRGEKASLIMETMNEKDITFCFSVHGPTGSPVEEGRFHPSKRWKTSSQLRRDKQRNEQFLIKKIEESKKKETSTVGESKAVLTEPKDEIVLEEIQQEDCEVFEKVFVIPQQKVDNHNIEI